MKMHTRATWLSAALLAALATSSFARADDLTLTTDPATGKVEARTKSGASMSVVTSPHPAGDRGTKLLVDGLFAARASANAGGIRKAAEAVRDAKDDEAKSAAQKKLVELLNGCYDADMVQREQELKQIEERLAKLRELLARRREKKQDIIDLQLKVALNEADGLGFYENERPARPNPFGYSLPGHPLDVVVGAASSSSEVPAPGPVPAPAAPPAPKAPKAVPH